MADWTLLLWRRDGQADFDALAAEGITLFLLSNSRKPGRPHGFAQKLDIPCIGHAGKPKREGFFRAMERMGVTPDQTVMVGDQIFTDVLGANRSGVLAVMVEPMGGPKGTWNHILHGLQKPFKARCKERK